ncbi:hypothetical protein BDP27DRAFT_1316301 [Rhodocollybia butyracea]|uniref:Uncharacterized protein n=1 Tax=Rhodocollybia butyracea TaxID=206335 RepID=A0A9P5UDB0_9AGAR|nr:hypothetical protein BDP27DRAFT_1316301 [Rhodocollybia butyracea]
MQTRTGMDQMKGRQAQMNQTGTGVGGGEYPQHHRDNEVYNEGTARDVRDGVQQPEYGMQQPSAGYGANENIQPQYGSGNSGYGAGDDTNSQYGSGMNQMNQTGTGVGSGNYPQNHRDNEVYNEGTARDVRDGVQQPEYRTQHPSAGYRANENVQSQYGSENSGYGAGDNTNSQYESGMDQMNQTGVGGGNYPQHHRDNEVYNKGKARDVRDGVQQPEYRTQQPSAGSGANENVQPQYGSGNSGYGAGDDTNSMDQMEGRQTQMNQTGPGVGGGDYPQPHRDNEVFNEGKARDMRDGVQQPEYGMQQPSAGSGANENAQPQYYSSGNSGYRAGNDTQNSQYGSGRTGDGTANEEANAGYANSQNSQYTDNRY